MAYGNLDTTADGGSTYLLPRLVGQGKALEIYLANQPMSAEYALDVGLVSQVIPQESFERHALEAATRLSQGPTLAYGRTKALFTNSWEVSLETQLNAEAEAIGNMALTEDFQEGIRAFNQKRQPWFQNR
jgi:2-(1,2-epoxy-1,2-dihydrophenyl)acetyl-CoA isomerase